MRVQPVEINWHPELPIFAKESFLKAVSDEYGWLGGFAESGELRCVLPYTIVRKAIFRMVRFRVETIPMVQGFDVSEEKSFLNGTIEYFRSIGADMVIPATTNTIFRTYPDGADAAPYGSYVIDLSQSEDVLWKNIDRITRQNIKSASKAGIIIRDAVGEEFEGAYQLIKDTFKRSKLPFMDQESFKGYLLGLAEFGKLLIADQQGVAQSFCVFAYSDYCAYAIYAGNALGQPQGANKLLYWEAIRLFKNLGVRIYDFVGARISPEKGSKQEALGLFKKRFGATLKHGYIWKYPLRPLKYRLYGLAARVRSGGDIVDAERHMLKDSGTGNS
ncbi:MAG: peptidoglycan bridge formation glycyltransferase FemA/FemB family protein [Candidatus Aminicenantales bacterium]